MIDRKFREANKCESARATMSLSIICQTFFALSFYGLVTNCGCDERSEKPKEQLRHQQSHRPLFIDRRLTLDSRIQRYATAEDAIANNVEQTSTESRYIDDAINVDRTGIDETANHVKIMDPDDSKVYATISETNIEKPATQIRHGRSRGHYARPITKPDEQDEDARTFVESAIVETIRSKTSLADDVRYVEINDTAYPDFDFDVVTVNENSTRSTSDNVTSSNFRTIPSVNFSSSNNNGRRLSEPVTSENWLDSSSGKLLTSINDPVDSQDRPKSDSSRLAHSFDQLRKVVAGSRGRGLGLVREKNYGKSLPNGSSDYYVENSTWYRSNLINVTRKTEIVDAIGDYGIMIHDVNHDDDSNHDDQPNVGIHRDFDDQASDNVDDHADRRGDPHERRYRGENSSISRIDDYDDDYWTNVDVDESTIETEKSDKQQTVQVDIVTRFLRIIENQHLVGENCTAGTDLNLGEGVVDRYAQERFRLEANLAVNRANMLTRLWKYAPDVMLSSEYLLHASVLSMVEFDEDIFAAGNCYDKLQYREHWLFCPFAHRLQDQDGVLVKDLAVEYKYLSNSSEWFYIARKNAERVIASNNQFSHGYHSYTHNESSHTNRIEDEILTVKYEDGRWSKPYYDCGGGNIWMLTYTVPFFGYTNDTYFFKGTSGIDIDLRRVDIDQCPLPRGSTQLNIFAASDKCKNRTTECVAIPGLGFRRGSYRCVCKRGYYYPDTKSIERYYNGTVIEEEYEKLMLGEDSEYSENGVFECLPCAEGCEYCEDGSPCVVSLNWLMRTAILILECCIIACLPAVILFTWKFGNVKVVRAASPVLLRVIVLGAFFIYCTTIVMYPRPNVVTCTIRVWLREIGFSLTYGALMLKTWRISVIFRVKSAKAVKITDMNLLKRLGIIVTIFAVFLGIRTLVAPPVVIVARTADDLKAYLCRTDWWDHSFTTLEVMFLVWGIRLCIVVRKAPSEFNESRFISMAIYNEFLLSVFLNVSMLFLQSPANPDLLYIIFFCHTQLTVTLLLCLIFGSKAYVVFRGGGKEDAVGKLQGTTGKFIGKSCRTQGTSNQTNSISLQQGNFTDEADGVTDEFRRLYAQLELLKEKNMRLGNRHLVTKIQAMQEASTRAEPHLSTIQALSSTMRLSIEPSSSIIELTEVSTRINEKSLEIDRSHRNDFAERIADTNKKLYENKIAMDDKIRRTNVQKEREIRTNGDGIDCTCAIYDNAKTIADKNDKEIIFVRSDKDDEAKTEIVMESDENVVGNRDNSKSQSKAENEEVDGPVESSTTRTREIDGIGGNGDGNNGKVVKKKEGKNKSGHARTHAIVINLDDKSRFSEEVTV